MACGQFNSAMTQIDTLVITWKLKYSIACRQATQCFITRDF